MEYNRTNSGIVLAPTQKSRKRKDQCLELSLLSIKFPNDPSGIPQQINCGPMLDQNLVTDMEPEPTTNPHHMETLLV